MKFTAKALLVSTCMTTCMTLSAVSFGAQTLTIATVNNSDMIRMQKLSKTFETEHPDIKLNWVVLEENVLRQRLTTDIATQGGQFDVLTIGMIGEFAAKLTDKTKEQYGLCLRGKAGWGENMALITTLANGYGARWFDEKWQPEFNGPEWKDALTFYVDNMKKSGPPGASSNGFNENLALFNSGKCAIWVDASVAGSFVTDKTQSKVADHVGFTFAPHEKTDKGTSWLYSWSLAIPTSSKAKDAAKVFTSWATSKEYGELVAKTDGIANVPPGTRKSTYSDEYMKAAPFAKVTLESLKVADPTKPTLKPVPYIGIQLVTIPEFQAIGTQVGKFFSGALTGQQTVDAALTAAQTTTEREMKRAGYPK